jgi:phosphatidylglycerol:prolipoprotein diacylglycerol transferase
MAVVTLDTGRFLELGPLSLPWHGLFTAIGIAVAALLAVRYAAERGLDRDRVLNLALAAAISGVVGARAFYLLEHDPGALVRPDRWLTTTGFSFWGAVIVAVPVVLAMSRRGNRFGYLDALASGFGLGMAIGRIGDILIGEHLGAASTLPWAFRYTNPDALAPSTTAAYHPGALYEALVGLIIFAAVWPRRRGFRPPGVLALMVVGLYAIGRFAIFFFRDDSDSFALGLSNAQVTSVLVAAGCGVALAGLLRADRRRRADGSSPIPPPGMVR